MNIIQNIGLLYFERPFTPQVKSIGALAAGLLAGGSALGSLLGGIFGSSGQSSANTTNLKIARETNAQNYKMFQQQLGFTEDLWNKTNAYNTPEAQRARWEQAGINPYLAMNSMDAGNANASSTPSPNPAVNPAPMQNSLAPLAEGISGATSSALSAVAQSLSNKEKAIDLMARQRRNEAEIYNMMKQGVLSDSQAKYYLSQDKRVGALLPSEVRLMNSQIGLTDAEMNEAVERTQLISLQKKVNEYDLNHIKPAQLRQINAEINALAADVASRRISAEAAAKQAETALKQYGLNKTEQDKLLPYMRDEIDSRIKLNRYNASPETVTEYNTESSTDGGSSKFGPISTTRPSFTAKMHRVTRSRGR